MSSKGIFQHIQQALLNRFTSSGKKTPTSLRSESDLLQFSQSPFVPKQCSADKIIQCEDQQAQSQLRSKRSFRRRERTSLPTDEQIQQLELEVHNSLKKFKSKSRSKSSTRLRTLDFSAPSLLVILPTVISINPSPTEQKKKSVSPRPKSQIKLANQPEIKLKKLRLTMQLPPKIQKLNICGICKTQMSKEQGVRMSCLHKAHKHCLQRTKRCICVICTNSKKQNN